MSIYPKINLPQLAVPKSENYTKLQRYAPLFDFESGEFYFGRGGKPLLVADENVFEQWCIKVCTTERLTRVCYTDRYGVEFEELPQMNDVKAVRSQIVRSLTEAIMVHPRTVYVKNFSFDGEGDHLAVTFDVRGDEEGRIGVEL